MRLYNAGTNNDMIIEQEQMDRFQNKYRIPTTRVAWHDYKGGAYFVTICTAERTHDFGEISNGQMLLSPVGICAQERAQNISVHFPHVDVPLFVVMPNHIHLIVIIHTDGNGTGGNDRNNVKTQNFASLHHHESQRNQQQRQQNKFGPQSQNLASVIRGFKIGVTKFSHQNNIPFEWQPRFHDRIIRNQEEMNRIAQYIEENISRWDFDKLNPINNNQTN